MLALDVPGRDGVGQEHCDLGVLDSSGGSGVLPLDPGRAVALLDVPCLVQHRVGVTEMYHHDIPHVVTHLVGIPHRHAAAVKAIGAGTADAGGPVWRPGGLPEPLDAVVAYLGDELDDGGREFVPTSELVEALSIEPTTFARQMAGLECRPTRDHVPGDDGDLRRVRGYRTADIRVAVSRLQVDDFGSSETGRVDEP